MKKLIKGFVWGIVITALVEAPTYFIPVLRRNFWDKPRLIFGCHIHHSVLALLLILISLFIKQKNKRHFLIGFGLGIIIIHTISGGFVFLECNL